MTSPVGRRVEAAFAGLLAAQNVDGGIPMVRRGDASGVWTTAEAISNLLAHGVTPGIPIAALDRAFSFCLENEIGETGAWPLTTGDEPSTLATSHCASLFVQWARLFQGYPSGLRAEGAAQRAIRWLAEQQNEDGSWGTAPEAGGDGAKGSVFATALVLDALVSAGRTAPSDPRVAGPAAQYLRSRQLPKGMWPSDDDGRPDPCNTGRALRALVSSAGLSTRSLATRRAVYAITRPASKRWAIRKWVLNYKKGVGQVAFNDNTVCDVVHALAVCRRGEYSVSSGLQFLLGSQESDTGLWSLQDGKRKDRIETWSTSGWAAAVSACAAYLPTVALVPRATALLRRGSLVVAAMLVTLIVFGQIGWTGGVPGVWDQLPDGAQNFIAVSVVLALIVGTLGSLLAASIDRGIKRIRTLMADQS